MSESADRFKKKEIVKKSTNLSHWYTDIIIKAKLADYAPIKGCMVIRPYGYALWENMQAILDKMIKEAGVENAYFPLFIPESFLAKEKAHVKGFSPELAIVTIGGGEKLKQRLVVRPTSETVMYDMFSKWIKSWRDLPLKINQWCNIIRWEKRTYLFLRTTEFLWQEGHTAHTSHQEAKEEVERALKMYVDFIEKYLAIPGIAGRKSQFDKFPGAIDTYSFESLMPNGKALQNCTSHDLGQNFSKTFNVQFQDKAGKLNHVWQTSWGFTTRAIGALVMVHGDNNGLVLPPKIAPLQVVIITIFTDKKDKILRKAIELKEKLLKANVRVKLDDRENYSLGYKINDWELKGVPLRIEIGEKELVSKKIKVVKRLSVFEPREIFLSETILATEINKILEETQDSLLLKAKQFLKDNTHEVNNWQEFKEVIKTKRGFIKAFWCESQSCEQKIKTETKASTRCLPLESQKVKGKCIYCGRASFYKWIFSQAY